MTCPRWSVWSISTPGDMRVVTEWPSYCMEGHCTAGVNGRIPAWLSGQRQDGSSLGPNTEKARYSRMGGQRMHLRSVRASVVEFLEDVHNARREMTTWQGVSTGGSRTGV